MEKYLILLIFFGGLILSLYSMYILQLSDLSSLVDKSLFILHEIKGCVISLYKTNPEYLLVSGLLAFEVYVFVFFLLRILAYSVTAIRKGYLKAGVENERGYYELQYGHSSYFFIAFIRYIITIIGAIKYILLARKPKGNEEINLDNSFIISALISSTVASVYLMLIYEVGQYLFWISFVFHLLLMMSFMIALGEIGKLSDGAKEELGISYKDDILMLPYGVAGLTVRGSVMALSLSIGAGICGILTTLGATILRAPLIFTLVPLTFDVLSLLSALVEFSGLGALPLIFGDLKEAIRVGTSFISMTIIWSLYFSGGIMALLPHIGLGIATGIMLNLISGIWIMVAVLLSILGGRLRLTRKLLAANLILSFVPLILLT